MREKLLLNEDDIGRTLERLAFEVLERHGNDPDLAFIGIQRRGVELAGRLSGLIASRTGQPIPLGKLDINLYRDDWTMRDLSPQIGSTDIPYSVDGMSIILVDDVLFTGRTIRAAMEAIMDFGRPRRIELLVLVDRGHRELPIQADFIGKRVDTVREDRVDVRVRERDGGDAVSLHVFDE